MRHAGTCVQICRCNLYTWNSCAIAAGLASGRQDFARGVVALTCFACQVAASSSRHGADLALRSWFSWRAACPAAKPASVRKPERKTRSSESPGSAGGAAAGLPRRRQARLLALHPCYAVPDTLQLAPPLQRRPLEHRCPAPLPSAPWLLDPLMVRAQGGGGSALGVLDRAGFTGPPPVFDSPSSPRSGGCPMRILLPRY